ncbi:MAG: apolipoprotein N-acyltransferase [Rhodobacteraceae bacterium PARR1]|nr:MAG: apolipoprotein N-acyltransferase [Rhodobacteraceae bacterium PARR1]
MLGVALIGAVAATGLAPLGWWWLALPAFALMIRQVARRPEVSGRMAWAAGFGYLLAALNWIVEPFLIDAARDAWMAPFALLGLPAGLALFWAGAGWIAGRWRLGAFGFALLLTLAELARGHVLTGFPWATPGQIWIDHAPAQAAALFGQYGLTLATLGVAAGLAAFRPVPVVLAAALLAAGFGYGQWRLSLPEPPAFAAPKGVTVRLVQPAAAQGLKWDAAEAQTFFQRQLDFTAAGPVVDLTIWPETAIPYTLEDYPDLAPMIAGAARGGAVALGIQRLQAGEGGAWQFYNSLVVLGPGGARLASYDKHHLVPFGEYVPFGDGLMDLTGIGAFAAQAGNAYTAGQAPAIITPAPALGRILPLICYEAVFPQDLRAPGERADWLLQVTNDAWFGTLTGPFQHAAQARLRAVEQGLPLVRVANTGVSAVYDARGRAVAELPFGQAGWLDSALPGALPATVYARFGEFPVSVVLIVMFCGIAFMRFQASRRFGA